jgi:hypothetical protein
MGLLVSDHGTVIHGGNVIVVGVFSFHVAVVVGISGAPVLRPLGERWSNLPSPLDGMRNSLGEF